jgi:hypothetical protein
MIGVIANSSDHAVVREFFELFKTPWEFYEYNRQYEVLLCCGASALIVDSAKLVVVYASSALRFDTEHGIEIVSQSARNCVLSYKGTRLPLYGDCTSFRQNGDGFLLEEKSRESILQLSRSGGKTLVRAGYDLFGEIRSLLTVGQPAANAGIPTLELHIALLRDLILDSGAALVEIPPVPDGYKLIASLTHDVDQPSIRQHKFDHTMFGFLYRAIFGSLIRLARGRMSVGSVLTNWAAVLKLPFIHLGLASDFWNQFDRYINLEKGCHSTFFIIPFKGDPGLSRAGISPPYRASPYGASDIADHIRSLMTAGCEIGVHGINAWIDSSKGREELEEIRSATGVRDVGARMHWLYFDEQSPAIMESAGIVYDSTVGYNETVGYRAGTTQAYKPLGATHLLELPLHVMDTALFYPGHLDLSPEEAIRLIASIVGNAVRLGGCITVNWHDRSISPERLWDGIYADLIDNLASEEAWFATASQTVSWFRLRRSAVFETGDWESGRLQVRVKLEGVEHLPGLRLRIHKVREARELSLIGAVTSEDFCEVGFKRAVDTATLSHISRGTT